MFAGILETIDLQNTITKQQQESMHDLFQAMQGVNELLATAEKIAKGHLNEFGTPGVEPFCLGSVSVSVARVLF
jgi:hypothetical protein